MPQDIPHPVDAIEAARLTNAALAKMKTLELECDLAYSRLQEAQLQTQLCNMKARQADRRLDAARVYFCRINLVLREGLQFISRPESGISLLREYLVTHSGGSGT